MRMSNLAVAAATLATAGGSLPAITTSFNTSRQLSGSVTMWTYPILPTNNSAYWNSKVAQFEKIYPDVKVNVVVQPWANRTEQLTTAIAGDSAPDVVYMDPDVLPNYAAEGALVNLAKVIGANKSNYLPSALQDMTFRGKLYGVPVLMQTYELVANKTAMRASGITQVPKTWTQLLADAPKAKRAGYFITEYDGFAAQSLDESFYPLLWEAGGGVYTDSGKKAAFNSAAGVAALTFVKRLVDGGYVPKGPLTVEPTTATDPAVEGKVVFLMQSDLSVLAGDSLPLSHWGVYPPLRDAKALGYGVTGGLAVLSESHNKPAAEAWVKWITSAANTGPFDKISDFYSPYKSQGNLFPSTSQFGQEERLQSYMYPGSNYPTSRQIMTIISPQIQAALLGVTTPKKALDTAANNVDALLARSS